LYPVQVDIDNDASPDWTVVHIAAEDTPGFLYSLSNALAMRDFYLYRVNIRSVRGKVQDDLFLGRRGGGKMQAGADAAVERHLEDPRDLVRVGEAELLPQHRPRDLHVVGL
jgi:UTP:GlnB (protein PII) uridylyltransferase